MEAQAPECRADIGEPGFDQYEFFGLHVPAPGAPDVRGDGAALSAGACDAAEVGRRAPAPRCAQE
eukprot:9002023-Pyramimonas_sp.AAC.1